MSRYLSSPGSSIPSSSGPSGEGGRLAVFQLKLDLSSSVNSLNCLPDFLLMKEVENLWCELGLFDIYSLEIGAVLGHCEQSGISNRYTGTRSNKNLVT